MAYSITLMSSSTDYQYGVSIHVPPTMLYVEVLNPMSIWCVDNFDRIDVYGMPTVIILKVKKIAIGSY